MTDLKATIATRFRASDIVGSAGASLTVNRPAGAAATAFLVLDTVADDIARVAAECIAAHLDRVPSFGDGRWAANHVRRAFGIRTR